MTVVPPHDLGAESCVLGSAMLSADAARTAVEHLRPEDFYRAAHGTVFAAIAAAVQTREPCDALAIAARLDAAGELARIGGAPYLHDLIASVPTAASVGWYARIVTERAAMRRLIDAGIKITQLGYDLDRDPGDAGSLAAKVLADASATRSADDLVPLSEIIGPGLDAIERAGANGIIPGLATGCLALDETLGGLRGGQLIVIAGRPAMGKSVVAIEWARQAAVLDGMRTAVFSLEMGRNEVFHRLISAHTGISLARVSQGRLSQTEWDTVASVSGRMSHAPLFVNDSAPMKFPDIVARARRLHAAAPLALVVVDYLQLLEIGGKTESRQQEVSEISRGLKLLAKELNCPVVAAAQLNRGVEMRQDKRPHLADLRESGAVEQDADVVILLHREKYYNSNTPRGEEIDLILAKHRNGPTGTIVALADFEHARLRNLPQ